MTVTLFADFTCPFSWAAETALARSGAEVRPRAFELFPAPAPIPPHDPADLAAAAELIGSELRDPGFRPRTLKAHEAARFGGAEMRRAIYRAYWEARRDIGRVDVLMEVAGELGLDPVELRIALDIDRYRDEVDADRRLAERLNITSVPVLFIGAGADARVLVGALSPAALDAALRQR